MSEKSRYLGRIYDKCPFCERPFRKVKYSVDSKLMKKWLEYRFNST